jgi:hypothetical protein
MSRFAALQKKFDELKLADDNYWFDLEKTVSEIFSGFGIYLGIPASVQSSSGAFEKWLYLGKVDESQFSECNVTDLVRSDRFLRFSVGLALSSEFSEKPKSFHTVSLMIVKTGQNYVMTSYGGRIPQVVIKDRDYGEVFSALDQHFEDLLNHQA